jgi:hypothetical protein
VKDFMQKDLQKNIIKSVKWPQKRPQIIKNSLIIGLVSFGFVSILQNRGESLPKKSWDQPKKDLQDQRTITLVVDWLLSTSTKHYCILIGYSRH